MKLYKQTETAYKKLMMGFGTSSVYSVGCYFISLLNGVLQNGFSFTPETFNEYLKERGAFIIDNVTNNYIDVDNIAKEVPDIFTAFRKHEPWTDMVLLESYLKQQCVVIGKVDARGIGGTGTHFVLITAIDGANVMIHDPWYGDTIKVAERYNKYGNILGLRVFWLKKKEVAVPTSPNMYQMKSGKSVDLSNMESNKVLAEVYDEVINQKIYTKTAEVSQKIEEAVKGRTGTLEQQIAEKQSTIDLMHEFREKIITRLNPQKDDDASIFGSIDGLLKVEDNLMAANKVMDQLKTEHKQEIDGYKIKIAELNTQLSTIRTENEHKLETMQLRIDDLSKTIQNSMENQKTIGIFSKIFTKVMEYIQKGKK